VDSPDFFLPVFQLMEETQQQSIAMGAALRTFMTSLLNYRANTSTVDMRVVKSNLDQWKNTMIEKEQTQEFLRQQYLEKHDIPRMTAKKNYEEYMASKNERMYQWLRSKNHGDLFHWLEMEHNKEDTSAFQDPVYTKYVKTSTP
jgi:hypothetical protein